MPNTLYIKKTTNGYFEFTVNGDSANTISNTRNDLTSIGDQLHFKTSNGANLIQKQEIYPSDLTLEYDSTIISSFSTVPAVFSGLIDAGFFAWIIGGGSGGGGVDKFEDLLDTFNYSGHNGMTVRVNETLQRLEPVAYRLTEKFTDLDDTPGNIIANKMVITNAAGDGLEYAEIPASQETNLNSIGYFIYQDLITQTTPIVFSSGTDTKITNDTNGTGTESTNAPFGIAKIWDSDLNQIDLSGCQVGDTVDLRIRLDTTTSSSNQIYKIKFKTAIGSSDEELVTVFTQITKTAGIDSQTFNILFPISSDNIKNNPSEIYIYSDGNGSVKVNKFYFRIIQKDINIIQLGQEGLDLKEDKINKIDTVTGISSIKYISEKCLVEYVASSAPVIPDATNTIKGKLKLAGDLGGTADAPTVPSLADKENISNKAIDLSTNDNTHYPTTAAVAAAIASSTIPDATTIVKGKIKLAGDLAGTADSPTVPGLSNKEDLSNKVNSITGNSATKYTSENAVKVYVDAGLANKEDISNKGLSNGYAGLDSGGKVPVSQLPNSIMEYKGIYNASTNTPTLIDGVGNTGDTYRTTVAGTGVNSLNFVIGDYAIYNGATWDKAHSGGDAVNSVFGRTGIIIAQSGDYASFYQAVLISGTNIKTLSGNSILGAGDLSIFNIVKTRKDITGTAYTIISSDVDKVLYTTNSSPVTITIPNALTAGQSYEIFQYAAGQVTLVGSSTTLLYSSYEQPKTAEIYSRVIIEWVDTEKYELYGELSAY